MPPDFLQGISKGPRGKPCSKAFQWQVQSLLTRHVSSNSVPNNGQTTETRWFQASLQEVPSSYLGHVVSRSIPLKKFPLSCPRVAACQFASGFMVEKDPQAQGFMSEMASQSSCLLGACKRQVRKKDEESWNKHRQTKGFSADASWIGAVSFSRANVFKALITIAVVAPQMLVSQESTAKLCKTRI